MFTNDSVVKFGLSYLNTQISEVFFISKLNLVHPTQEELHIHVSTKFKEFIKRNVYTEVHHNGSNSYEFIAEIKSVPDLDDDNYAGNCTHSISESISLNSDDDSVIDEAYSKWLIEKLNIKLINILDL